MEDVDIANKIRKQIIECEGSEVINLIGMEWPVRAYVVTKPMSIEELKGVDIAAVVDVGKYLHRKTKEIWARASSSTPKGSAKGKVKIRKNPAHHQTMQFRVRDGSYRGG